MLRTLAYKFLSSQSYLKVFCILLRDEILLSENWIREEKWFRFYAKEINRRVCCFSHNERSIRKAAKTPSLFQFSQFREKSFLCLRSLAFSYDRDPRILLMQKRRWEKTSSTCSIYWLALLNSNQLPLDSFLRLPKAFSKLGLWTILIEMNASWFSRKMLQSISEAVCGSDWLAVWASRKLFNVFLMKELKSNKVWKRSL